MSDSAAAGADPAPAIRVEGLEKSYGEIRALAGVTFSVARGEIFGLLGKNGAGKSTALEILDGLRRPDRGTVEILGLDVARERTRARELLGVMLQSTHLPPRLRAREAVELFAAFHERPRPAAEVLAAAGLRERADAAFSVLSGGERQRLALALALVHDPEVLLLDEPTAGLDAHARRSFHALLFDLKRRGRTVLLTTHHVDEAERVCDRVAILHRGRLLACGAPAELVAARPAAGAGGFGRGAPLEDVLLEITAEAAGA